MNFPAHCTSLPITLSARLTIRSSTINIPFPTARLAAIARRSLSVDAELSPLVQRAFSVAKPSSIPSPDPASNMTVSPLTGGVMHMSAADQAARTQEALEGEEETVLVTEYRATTNRMLRVSVNGFFESLGVVLSCMRELDGDGWAGDWAGVDGENPDLRDMVKVQGLQETGLISAT